MVSEDKMQEEIDKATVSLGMQKELDLYSILLRIKYAKDREELIDREVKVCRAKLEHAWQIDKKILDDLQVECEKIGDKKMEVLQKTRWRIGNKTDSFLWVVDCSGSMYGEKIGIVNNTIQECIPEMRSAADNNRNAQLLIRALAVLIRCKLD